MGTCTKCGSTLEGGWSYADRAYCPRCREESSNRAQRVSQGKTSLGAARKLVNDGNIGAAIRVLRDLIDYCDEVKWKDTEHCEGAKEMLDSLQSQMSQAQES